MVYCFILLCIVYWHFLLLSGVVNCFVIVFIVFGIVYCVVFYCRVPILSALLQYCELGNSQMMRPAPDVRHCHHRPTYLDNPQQKQHI